MTQPERKKGWSLFISKRMQTRSSVSIILLIFTYFYFRYIKLVEFKFSLPIFFVLILVSLFTAFSTRRRDITLGILFGLVALLLILLIVFIFFPERM